MAPPPAAASTIVVSISCIVSGERMSLPESVGNPGDSGVAGAATARDPSGTVGEVIAVSEVPAAGEPLAAATMLVDGEVTVGAAAAGGESLLGSSQLDA